MNHKPKPKYLLPIGILGSLLCACLLNGKYSNSFKTPETSRAPQTIPRNTSPAKPAVNKSAKPTTILSATPKPQEKHYYLLDTPNDPAYSSAWYLSAVNASAGWDISIDSSNVTVAVIDTGFALDHDDLHDAWYINQGEYGDGKESDGIDNDGDGYIDDWRGWDFVSSDNDPQAGSLNQTGNGVSHGTETAGLVGATSNNGIGVASISRNARILPLQVMDDDGNGYSDAVASAINYAVARHVQVISMSLGTSGNDPLVQTAVDNAYQAGVIVVAAAGNCGNSSAGPCAGQPSGYITFPANYNRVISVGATTSSGAKASFSSYGERLDVMAPGSGTIVSPAWTSTNGTSAYATSLQGTSFSAPIVASTAALIRSIRPVTSIDDVRAIIMGSAQKLSNMNSTFYTQSYGHGLVDVGAAMTIANDLNATEITNLIARQTAGSGAEHLYSTSDTLGSGCQTDPGVWCTTWLRNEATNYERFLPYTKTDSGGEAGWSYSANSLYQGEWQAQAEVGDIKSDAPYILQKK